MVKYSGGNYDKWVRWRGNVKRTLWAICHEATFNVGYIPTHKINPVISRGEHVAWHKAPFMRST